MHSALSRFEEEITALTKTPGRETAGLSITLFEEDSLLYGKAWGHRFIDNGDSGNNLPMMPSTLCRVASISKIVCTLTTLIQEEKGTLDFSRDLSDYLDYPLYNPHFPGQPLTAAHLLTHTSSLRDGTVYNLPREVTVRSILAGKESLPNWDTTAGPDAFRHVYCNLGYGVLATVLERITGQTFDSLVHETLLDPLTSALEKDRSEGTTASFNLQRIPEHERRNLAEIYRKENPSGPWMVQCDSRESVGKTANDKGFYAGYEPGTNGTLFAPQGGLRASALYLSGLGRLFLGRGKIMGTRIVSEDIIKKMAAPRKNTGKEEANLKGECGYGLFSLNDALHNGESPLFWGHHGDAYGLKGALYFDPVEKRGFSYLMTGCAEDPEKRRGLWSSRNLLEETLTALIVRTFWHREA